MDDFGGLHCTSAHAQHEPSRDRRDPGAVSPKRIPRIPFAPTQWARVGAPWAGLQVAPGGCLVKRAHFVGDAHQRRTGFSYRQGYDAADAGRPSPSTPSTGNSSDRWASRSEIVAQFKTLKYHPGFPGRFHDLTAAIAFCRSFFPWYNTEHRHAGIAMLTPDDVHHHRAHSVLEQRERTLQAAWAHHPERFVRGVPQPEPLPQAVWINPPATTTTGDTAQ